MTCKDCLHYEACDRLADAKLGYGIMQIRTGACKCFSDKSEWCHLPCKPLPLLKDGNPCNTDVYCPTCGENLSGYYTESQPDVVVCFNCGEILNITKAVAREEVEKALEKRRRNT